MCRCGSYTRVRKALARVAESARRAPAAPASPGAAPGGHVFNPWVAIADDGTVTVVIDRAEMGQGAVTGLAMLVAEVAAGIAVIAKTPAAAFAGRAALAATYSGGGPDSAAIAASIDAALDKPGRVKVANGDADAVLR